jgi:hypothetical protein
LQCRSLTNNDQQNFRRQLARASCYTSWMVDGLSCCAGGACALPADELGSWAAAGFGQQAAAIIGGLPSLRPPLPAPAAAVVRCGLHARRRRRQHGKRAMQNCPKHVVDAPVNRHRSRGCTTARLKPSATNCIRSLASSGLWRPALARRRPAQVSTLTSRRLLAPCGSKMHDASIDARFRSTMK